MISALISCPTIKEAAALAKIGETTLHARMNDPEFKKKYSRACANLLDAHAAALQVNMGQAIKTQREIMDNAANPPQVRLNAASEILRIGLNITDRVSVMRRLEELESRLEESER